MDIGIQNFLLQNAPHLTIRQLSEDFGRNEKELRKYCDELGIKPAGVTEQLHRYILDHHKHKTIAQIAKLTERTEQHIENIFRKLGLQEISVKVEVEVKIEAQGPTPREILSKYRINNGIHHNLGPIVTFEKLVEESKKMFDKERSEE